MEDVKKALAPLEFVVSALGGLTILLMAVVIPATVLGSGSFLGFGESSACIDAPVGTVSDQGEPSLRIGHLTPDGHANASRVDLCTFHPTHKQLLLQIGTELPKFLFFLGVLLLIWLILRAARTRGLFSPHVALGVLRLGTYLFVGSFVAAGIEAVASVRLIHTMGPRTPAFLPFFHLSWTVVFVSFACLTLGRTLAQAVRMQREIDATV